MSWASYYNYALLGDVLLLIYEPEARPFSYQKKENVVAIYDEKQALIGVNIFAFSSIIKMKTKGRIPFFPQPVFEIINNVLKNANLPTLEEPTSSGFMIGKIKEIRGEDMRVSLVDQEIIMKKIPANVGDQILIATPGTILFNGIRVEKYHPIKENEMEFSSSQNYLVFQNEKEGDFFLR